MPHNAAAAAAGVVVMFAGAIMMHELLLQPLLNWIVPLALLLGLLLLAGVALEVLKAKVRGRLRHLNMCCRVFLCYMSGCSRSHQLMINIAIVALLCSV
jgi:hypothetical protein